MQNNFLRNAYKYDYFIQVDLAAVNGLTLKENMDKSKTKSERRPIANIFFKVNYLLYLLLLVST